MTDEQDPGASLPASGTATLPRRDPLITRALPGDDWPTPARFTAYGLIFLSLVLFIGVVYYTLRLLFFAPDDLGYRDTALANARQAAAEFTTYDYKNAAETFARFQSRATGDFHDQVKAAQDALVEPLRKGKVTSRGVVRDAAITSANPKEVRIVAAVDETVTNTASAEPQLRRYRFSIAMTKVDGRWLVSDLQIV